MGIEPTYLAWKASVLPLNYTRMFLCAFASHRIYMLSSRSKNFDLLRNAQNRNRTSDTRIFSPLLYQLSYLGRRLNPYERYWLTPRVRHNNKYNTQYHIKCQALFLFFLDFFHNVFIWLP